jgi:hypothetical protein
LILSLAEGRAIGGCAARFLLCVPLFIAAEVIVHQRIKITVKQFLDREIVAPEDLPRFEQCIASAMRLRNSTLAEVLLLALALFGGFWMDKRYVATQSATWFATAQQGQTLFTVAGYWYILVSLTILRFLALRWYFRLLVWYRFVWQVSRRVPLQLNALHPDRAAGLGFLSSSTFAFQPILLAHTVTIAGVLGGKIWHEGAMLPQFKLEIVVWMAGLMLLVLMPLFVFILTSRPPRGQRRGNMESSPAAMSPTSAENGSSRDPAQAERR